MVESGMWNERFVCNLDGRKEEGSFCK